MRSVVSVMLVAWMCTAACHDSPHEAPPQDPERPKRVIEPPSGKVKPLPPHAIRADGIGPYKLGVSLEDLARQLPSGPRLAALDIPGVVHHITLLEDDAILIGGELGRASFVAVVGGEIARTENGIHVGSSRAELTRALGVPITEIDRARDPRLVEPGTMREARFVVEEDKVVAIAVLADAAAGTKPGGDGWTKPGGDGCIRPPPTEQGRFGTCMSSTGEIVVVDGDMIAVRAVDGDRVFDDKRLPGLVFAAPLRAAGEARDELVAIVRGDEPSTHTWTLVAYRLDAGKLVRVSEPAPLYQLSASADRSIGVEAKDRDLYLELAATADAFEVSGLLSSRSGGKLRDLVVISAVNVPRRRAKLPAPEAGDAGASDAAR